MKKKFRDETRFGMFDRDVQDITIPEGYKEMSVLKQMEALTEMAEETRLSDEFFEKVLPLSSQLGERLGLTPEQAVLYSIFIDNYNDSQIGLHDIRRHTGASMIRIAQLQDDIEALEKKHLICRSSGIGCVDNSSVAYHVPMESVKSLRANKPYVPKPLANLSFDDFVHELCACMNMRYCLGAPYQLFCEDLDNLVCNNMHLKICQAIMEQSDVCYLDEDQYIFLIVMCAADFRSNNRLDLHDLGKIFDGITLDELKYSIESECNPLQRHGLVEYGTKDGLADKTCLVLTRKARKLLLSESRRKSNSMGGGKLKDHKKIDSKSLFYDAAVKQQVERLDDMLSPKSFGEICKRLKQHKMRRGFACLFYGAPGTGKTETVLQLAKKTGRNIMQVDFSEIKDKFVGESEKNVKAIFDNYREAVINAKLCPILLLNEADAIIGRRLENVEHSVDNMFNTMQNIILQEMETFEGILIATTNLEGNMDSAFERRFLYKVRFEKPSAAVRKQIWQSIIPSLSDDTALLLAREFEFSGGQIENIARKQIVDNILYGESDDIYASLRQYCKEESIQNRKSRPNIGFSA